jgi:hypothetical protein
MTADVKHNGDGTSDKGTRTGEAESEAVWPEIAVADADLARVVAAWPTLLPDAKAAIVAMIQTAAKA